MATPELKLNLNEVMKQYTLFWKIWPEYVLVGSERRQVGFEVELIGSHSSDPSHIDPACAICHRVQHVLLLIAAATVEEIGHEAQDSVRYEITDDPQSVVCSPGWGNRACVAISIHILHKRGFDHPVSQAEADFLESIRTHLLELGLSQR